MIKLFDITIGDFAVTQTFGANPQTYNWIKDIDGKPILGHNGVDLATLSGTILLNPFPREDEVIISKVGVDPNGYGNFVRIWNKTQNCVVLYGHCQRVLAHEGDYLYFQQSVAESDNTGWSTGPHLHIGLYQVDDQGNKINRQNGYDGYLNILDPKLVEWTILNPSTPAPPLPEYASVVISALEHTKLVTKADNYKRVTDYLGIGPSDEPISADDVIKKIKEIEAQKAQPQAEVPKPTETPTEVKPSTPSASITIEDRLKKLGELIDPIIEKIKNLLDDMLKISKIDYEQFIKKG